MNTTELVVGHTERLLREIQADLVTVKQNHTLALKAQEALKDSLIDRLEKAEVHTDTRFDAVVSLIGLFRTEMNDRLGVLEQLLRDGRK